MHLSYEDLGLYLIVFNVFLGVLFGFFPLLVGSVLKVKKTGMIGFAASIVGGALVGFFLSFPAALIFTWLILKKYRSNDAEPLGDVLTAETDHIA